MITYTFELGVLDVPLFHHLLWPDAPAAESRADASKRGRDAAGRRRDHIRSAKPAPVTITIDNHTFDALADALEIDAEGLAYELNRYSRVGYRPKTEGLTGGRLGDVGEMLAYLVHREVAGNAYWNRLVRVTRCWSMETQATVAMPDFLVATGHCLEVKSREALDYKSLISSGASGLYGACDALKGARDEALYQLGRQGLPSHLVLDTVQRRTVAFPASAGIVNVVLLRDQRLQNLNQTAATRVTRRDCQVHDHTCWDCLDSFHGLLVDMHNEPGELQLIGASEPEQLVAAYSAWTRAVWARSNIAVEAVQQRLVGALGQWLQQPDWNGQAISDEDSRRSAVAVFWERYLKNVPVERGMQALPVQLSPQQGRPGPETEVMRAEPVSVVVDSFGEPLGQQGDREHQLARYAMRARVNPGAARAPAEYVLTIEEHSWEVKAVVETQNGLDLLSAQSLVIGMLQAVDPAIGLLPDIAAGSLWLRALTFAGRDEGEIHVGWRIPTFDELPGLFQDPARAPRWLKWLRFGDPRARLYVLRDGRARLTARWT